MEPDDITQTNLPNSADVNTGSSSTTVSQSDTITFPVPQQVSKPMITRPIIKRRRTVIQASPARMNLAINAYPATTAAGAKYTESAASTTPTTKLVTKATDIFPSATTVAAPGKKLSKTQSLDSLNTIATQYPSNIISVSTQVPSNTTTASEIATTTAIVTKATETSMTATASAATSMSSLITSNAAANVAAAAAPVTTSAASDKSTTRSSKASKTLIKQSCTRPTTTRGDRSAEDRNRYERCCCSIHCRTRCAWISTTNTQRIEEVAAESAGTATAAQQEAAANNRY
ncbi:unnamed protein product [Ceratitis capitata]|uniref:(Mediterranean fruit fly) hypothetical protein n=1 Tax=Ceratitis capitata TaxID=7213 RepID=A0A811UH99_CERCA|nr:unnamed protein product [Ceratitis capitata]